MRGRMDTRAGRVKWVADWGGGACTVRFDLAWLFGLEYSLVR